MSIKEDSEVQHALAHLWLAVDYLAKGEPEAARYELDGIEGLIFFADEHERLTYLRGKDNGQKSMPGPTQTTEEKKEI